MIGQIGLILNILTPLFYIGTILLLIKRIKELENHNDFITNWLASLDRSTKDTHQDLYLTIARTRGMISQNDK